jgi:two-component system, OmpR family, phosphate regulon sensor histidine kinase PhoR
MGFQMATRESWTESDALTQEQKAALRGICERLAYLSGSSLPPLQNSLDEYIASLNVLAEACGRKIHRGTRDSEELREVRHELENVERLKARFIKSVSHELRTPLACIDGFARALMKMEDADAGNEPADAEAPPEEVRRQFLTIISQEAQRLSVMVEDVLSVSDIEGNKRKREPVLFSAEELFADTLNAYSSSTRSTVPPIAIRIKEGPSAPTVFADRGAMVEVLRELLTNAHKFSEGKEVVLGAERVSIAPDRLTQATDSGLQQRVSTATRIYVKDQGIGIPPGDAPHVFDKFFRSEQAANKYPGTGLGLAIVRALVAQDNGQVWCTSTPGSGSTFHVLLPDCAPGDA